MIFRPAAPADSPEMTRLIESHHSKGGMELLYARRPGAYESYITENPETEATLCADEGGRILAQVVCMPRKLYIGGEAQMVRYVTGLHKAAGARVDMMKLFDAAYERAGGGAAENRFFCSILDDNKAAYDLFAKRGMISPICDYTTYFVNPSAIKRPRHGFSFRRAGPKDAVNLLSFYNKAGSGYSYFPVFSSMDDFPGLSAADFFLLEDGEKIIGACALWDQRAWKQYIAIGYKGAYKIAARCNPLLGFLRYPPLPKKGAAANFAYIAFFLCRGGGPSAAQALLGEIGAAGSYDFLTIGAARGGMTAEILDGKRSIRIGSKLCLIDYERKGAEAGGNGPLLFECGLL